MSPAHTRVAHGRGDSARPLLLQAADRVGMRRAFKTLAFMAAWDVAREKMRRDAISLQEYAEYWNVSRSASFREQATFREAFPDEDTPERLLNLAQQQWDVRAGAAGLGRVKLA